LTTSLFVEQTSKARFGNALGDLIQEDVVPGVRIVQLLLVTLAQKLCGSANRSIWLLSGLARNIVWGSA
jgi:hypothetical protein